MKDLKRKPIFKIGMSAVEVMAELAKLLKQDEEMRFIAYNARNNIEEEKAGSEKQSERSSRHEAEKDLEMIMEAGEVTEERLSEIISSLSDLEGRSFNALNVSSFVSYRCVFKMETERHIPMIDFKLEVSPENMAKIEYQIKKWGLKGLLLESGRSYHFYGTEFLDRADWVKFMGKILLFSEVINGKPEGMADSRWIGHRLIDGFGNLRISKGGTLRNKMPEVVSIIK